MNTLSQSVRDRVGEPEWSLRVELATAYRVFAQLGWTHLIHTHITAKVPDQGDQYLINPYGFLWEEITASSLVKVDAKGGILDPGSTDSSINPAGFKIHSAIHTSKRGANWVMHIHVPEVNAVANLKKGLIRGLSVYAMDIGGISYHDFEHATTEESDVCRRMVEDLGPVNKVLLLRNHGSITIGDTVHEAFYLTYELVKACKVQVLTQSMVQTDSDIAVVPDESVQRTFEIVQDNYTGEAFGRLEWEAAKRAMEADQRLEYRT